ncbi:MAG: alpha-isopropylmalate synthase regulatory domain-containing protein [Caldilineaceae bacterium]
MGDEIYQPEGAGNCCGFRCSAAPAGADRRGHHPQQARPANVITDAGFGAGPVDAVYQGINRVVGVSNNLVEFLVQAVTEGIDANGDVTIRIRCPTAASATRRPPKGARRRLFSGRGVDADASWPVARRMQALNKALATK